MNYQNFTAKKNSIGFNFQELVNVQPGVEFSSPEQPAPPSNVAPSASNSPGDSEKAAKRPYSRVSTTYPRKRAVTACELCRLKKIKCDNQIPTCGSCQKVGAICSLKNSTALNNFSNFDPASLAILGKVDDINKKLSYLLEEKLTLGGAGLANFSLNGGTTNASSNASSPSAMTDTTISKYNTRNTPRLERDVLSWRFFRAKYDDRLATSADMNNIFLLARNKNYFDNPEDVSMNINPSEISILVDKFVKNVHSKDPVLDLDYLHKSVSEMMHVGNFSRNEKSCVVAIVCALGSTSKALDESYKIPFSASSTEIQVSKNQSKRFFSIAISILHYLNCTSLITPQIQLLFGIYYMYFLDPLNAWSSITQASINCMLQFQQKSNDGKTQATKERLYWACFKYEKEVRETLGLPDGVFACPNRMMPYPCDNSDDKSLYLIELESQKVSSEITTRLYENTDWDDIPTHDLMRIVNDYDVRLDIIYSNIEPEVNQSRSSKDHPNEMLELLKYRFCWLSCYLYRPLMYRFIHYSDISDAEIFEYTHKFLNRSLEMYKANGSYKHRHGGIWIQLREKYSNILVLLSLYLSRTLYTDLNMLEEIIEAYVEKVSYWILECPDLADSIRIIRMLFNDLKMT